MDAASAITTEDILELLRFFEVPAKYDEEFDDILEAGRYVGFDKKATMDQCALAYGLQAKMNAPGANRKAVNELFIMKMTALGYISALRTTKIDKLIGRSDKKDVMERLLREFGVVSTGGVMRNDTVTLPRIQILCALPIALKLKAKNFPGKPELEGLPGHLCFNGGYALCPEPKKALFKQWIGMRYALNKMTKGDERITFESIWALTDPAERIRMNRILSG